MTSRGQSGSIPLVLLAGIILAGLIVALFTIVQSSQRSSGRDRDVAQSIQVADAGVQEAFVRLAEVSEVGGGGPLDVEPGSSIDLGDANTSAAAGEGTYTWQARRVGRGLWEVRSVGEYRTHTSVVEAEIGWQQQFPFALWGTSQAGITAGNAVLGHLDPDGLPAMGSNGPITVPNSWTPPQSTIVPDDVTVECYGDDREDNCDGVPGADLYPIPLSFPDVASAAYAPASLNSDIEFAGACYDNGAVDDGVFDPDKHLPFQRGDIHCFSQVVFDRGGDAALVEGDSDEPVRIFIRPTAEDGASEPALIVGGAGTNHAVVNWELPSLTTDDFKADPSSLQSTAADLQINVGGNRLVSFDNNSSRIAAGIYAPLARCEIRAQVTVVGAMVCGEIPLTGPGSGSGGWTLFYDPGLEEASVDGVFSVRRWAQGFCGRSNLDWADTTC